MALSAITYNTVVEHVKSWILANCMNFDTTIANLPACFKTGYSVVTTITTNAKSTVTISKGVSQVASTTVATDMTNFLTTIQVNDKLNTNIVANEFLNFVEDIISFCSTKIGIAASQYSTTNYMVYLTGNTNYSSLKNITTTTAYRLIDDADITTLINFITSVVRQNIRPYVCTYSVTLA